MRDVPLGADVIQTAIVIAQLDGCPALSPPCDGEDVGEPCLESSARTPPHAGQAVSASSALSISPVR
ncbi:MAG: hypothetical protein P4L40_25965 [Terracidiphilus sp.]|nr:hypothetical protein [Terracidiphilus sp.]